MTLEEITVLEQQWREREKHLLDLKDEFGWEPYPAEQFDRLLVIAWSRNLGPFLDVGCGIGTKCLLAQARDIRSYGIENKPEYVAEAQRLGVSVYQEDIREFKRYGEFGIVYINHPLRDPDEEYALEKHIQSQMAVGSVLITVNNVRAAPAGYEGWKMIATPLWSHRPLAIRLDWVARKIGAGDGSGSDGGKRP